VNTLLVFSSSTQLSKNAEGLPFLLYLKRHVREVTATTYIKRLKLLAKVGNLDKPEANQESHMHISMY